MKKQLKLEHVFNMEQWNTLQKSLSQVTGLAIITVDYKGIPVTEHSGCHEFCRKIRSDAVLGEFCQKCDSRGGLESIRTNQPYIYQCCFSIIDIAIPIIVDNIYLGAIMAGQVRLPVDQNIETLEKIYIPSSTNDNLIKKRISELTQDYDAIPVLQYEQIQIAAMMLFNLCNYLVREVDNKNQTISIYEAILLKQDSLSAVTSRRELELINSSSRNDLGAINSSSRNDLGSTNSSSRNALASTNSVHKQKNIMISAPSTHALQQELQHKINSSNRIIQKAFDYICSHRKETISLKTMSDYCFVSSSYLSRLFTREVGENYSSFVTKVKVGWAKELLETSDDAVSKISEELGFNDVSYFIRLFKKQVGLTPAFYRTYMK